MHDDIYRTCDLFVQIGFERVGDPVGVGDVQCRIDQNMQIDKNFASDAAGSQLMPLMNAGVGLENRFNLCQRLTIQIR